MSLPTIIGAYTDCFEYFDKALADRTGIRVSFAEYTEAKYFVMRMAQARVLQRDESRRVYEKDHPLWNKSEYDGLQVKMPVDDTEGHWWVYIIRHNSRVLAVEAIDGDFAEVKLLEAPNETRIDD